MARSEASPRVRRKPARLGRFTPRSDRGRYNRAVPDSDSTLVVEREFGAQPAELYRAWVEPDRLRRWFQPIAGVEAARVELEPRPGGALALAFRHPSGG